MSPTRDGSELKPQQRANGESNALDSRAYHRAQRR
jgi:hypothetical protein